RRWAVGVFALSVYGDNCRHFLVWFCSRPTSAIYQLFFFNDTATTEIYTLSLHDALPIYAGHLERSVIERKARHVRDLELDVRRLDRKSTRLNSSHLGISYAVFCLKKKKKLTHRNIISNLIIFLARTKRYIQS